MSDSRYYQRRINQKLIFAREMIALGSEAATEAAVWHLCLAYRAWLAEIITDIHHPLSNAKGLTATELAASASAHIPAALAECVQLEARPDSWLSQLLQANELGHSLVNKPPVNRPGMIVLTDTTGTSLPNAETLTAAIAELDALIERFRDAMQEC